MEKKRECNEGKEREGAQKAKEGSLKNYKFPLSLKVAKEWCNIPFSVFIF